MVTEHDTQNRWPITISIMLATVMNSLDTTIANVALPHIQGSVSASSDQITWVLTSYIVSAAIMTPLSGWLADRIGRKKMFLISIGGFTVASMLCGIATSLPEIVIFRLLQGVAGAALIPLSQPGLVRLAGDHHLRHPGRDLGLGVRLPHPDGGAPVLRPQAGARPQLRHRLGLRLLRGRPAVRHHGAAAHHAAGADGLSGA